MSYENPIPCKYCDDDIYFDDDHMSDSGKKIPMDAETEAPHHCPGRQYTRERKQAFGEDQQYAGKTNERNLFQRMAALEERVEELEKQKK